MDQSLSALTQLTLPQQPPLMLIVLMWLIVSLPILAGAALFQRWQKGITDGPALIGLASAVLWTVWTLLEYAGAVPHGALGQLSIWVAALLFGSTLYDWARSLFAARPLFGDWVVIGVTVLCVGLAVALWLGLGAPEPAPAT